MDEQQGANAAGEPDDSINNNAPAPNSANLESIKKEALQELVPLVDSMDVSPERKFEVIMSAVRVDFSEELLRKALEAAKGISDSAEKATALIDIVNEANFQTD